MMFPQHKARMTARAGTTQRLERGAMVLGIIWAAGVLVFAILSPPAGGTTFLTLAMTVLVVLLPLALIWLALTTLGTLRELRAETAALHAALDTLREAGAFAPVEEAAASEAEAEPRTRAISGDEGGGQAPLAPRAPAPRSRPAAAAPPAGPTMAARNPPGTGTMRPASDTTREAGGGNPSRGAAMKPAAPSEPADEPALALGSPDGQPPEPLPVDDFIRALQFPDSPEDAEGVRALRLALEDRELARLIRAAQDVLTLLSQEGLYMDDLTPEVVQPEQWRLFASGLRGDEVAGVGGIRDHAALALTATRMREDAIFRDAAHHFLRAFDRTFQAFEQTADDAEIADLAQTRTARAFMLFGRVAGVFD